MAQSTSSACNRQVLVRPEPKTPSAIMQGPHKTQASVGSTTAHINTTMRLPITDKRARQGGGPGDKSGISGMISGSKNDIRVSYHNGA